MPVRYSQRGGKSSWWSGGSHGGLARHTKSNWSAKSALSGMLAQKPRGRRRAFKKSTSARAIGSTSVGHVGPSGELRVRRATCFTFRTQAFPSSHRFSRYRSGERFIPTYMSCFFGHVGGMCALNCLLISKLLRLAKRSMGSMPIWWSSMAAL